MSASDRLSPMASYYVRRLVQSRRELIEQTIQDPAVLEATLLEPEALLSRLSLQPMEYLQRVNNLEIFARAYQNLSKENRYPEETKEIEKQILKTLGVDAAVVTPQVAIDKSTSDATQLAEAAIQVDAKQALEVLQSLMASGKGYLGPKITGEYLMLSRPAKAWLESFAMTSSHQLQWSGLPEAVLTDSEIEDLRIWIQAYLKKCSQIIHNFHETIDAEKLEILSRSPQGFRRL